MTHTRDSVLQDLRDNKVAFLRLQFTDITGANKNVELPPSQFEKAVDGQILFDGSSIEGFVRIEESDMILVPDFDTYLVFPWDDGQGKVGRIICDVHHPDESPFEGCPRGALKRQVAVADEMGYSMMAGPEAEFFLFQLDEDGGPTLETHDSAGYFDMAPVDQAEECRREMVQVLEALHFEVEAAHHEVAPGQHEIDFKYGDALATADNLCTFKFVVRKVAQDYGLHATFMPKPIYGINGSGMHTHQSLFQGGENAFFDPDGEYRGISKTGLHYIGGLTAHAQAFCALTNPIVNSYKRLVPGYEAPTEICWSERNRSPLARVPDRRGVATRVELRSPDPSCNPYLAFAGMLAAGLDGVAKEIDPGPPVNANLYAMSAEERAERGIKSLPGNLKDAVAAFEASDLMRVALGDHIFTHFVAAKRTEWQDYIGQVHSWEIDRYLTTI